MNGKFLIFCYILCFYLLVFLWPSLRTYLRTGENPMKLGSGPFSQRINGMVFKIVSVTIFLVATTHSFADHLYIYFVRFDFLEGPAFRFTGFLLSLIAMVFILVAQHQMGNSWRIGIETGERTELVEKGLFSISRNPVFLGITLAYLGFFLVFPNLITLIAGIANTLAIRSQVKMEEGHLEKMYGTAYTAYRRRVPRWW